MKKTLSLNQAAEISKKLQKQGKSIVLVGGCFDVIHIGHVDFLEKSKAYGDVLVVLLESDETIRRLKGKGRPIHTQDARARILSALSMVDFIILLAEMKGDKAYDDVIFALEPAIIATTIGDPGRAHKERQAQHLKSLLIDIPKVKNISSSRVAQILQTEL